MLPRIGLLLAAGALAAFPQSLYRPQTVSAREFPVMAWGSSPADPEQLQGMKEAGLNIS